MGESCLSLDRSWVDALEACLSINRAREREVATCLMYELILSIRPDNQITFVEWSNVVKAKESACGSSNSASSCKVDLAVGIPSKSPDVMLGLCGGDQLRKVAHCCVADTFPWVLPTQQ